MRTSKTVLAGMISLMPLAAMAQTSNNYPMYPAATSSTASSDTDFLGFKDGTFSAGPKLGTLGIGAEVGYRPFSMFGVRLDGEAFSFSDDISAGRVRYHATAELQSYGALADLYPFGESFRVTAGLRLNENQIRGQSTSVRTTLAGQQVTVPTDEFGSLGAKVTFDKLSPYVGFGWGGDLGSGFSITTDFGVMFNGNPKGSVDGSLNANAGGALGNALASQVSAAALSGARSDLQHYIDGYAYYPVIEIGVTYKF